jgi:hypothetical protein
MQILSLSAIASPRSITPKNILLHAGRLPLISGHTSISSARIRSIAKLCFAKQEQKAYAALPLPAVVAAPPALPLVPAARRAARTCRRRRAGRAGLCADQAEALWD